jgi:hypothetical protein
MHRPGLPIEGQAVQDPPACCILRGHVLKRMKWCAGQRSQTTKWDRWRWPVRCVLVLVLVIGIFSLPLVCTTTIILPTKPSNRVTVYLLDHGHTPSLVLPLNDGRMSRYIYGDWNYYALGNRGLTDALLALFWPTRGALGRQQMAGPPGVESLRRQVGVEIERIYALEVERSDVERLNTRLDKILDAQDETVLVNVANDLEFGHHPQEYTYFHNSNHVAARWLRELGCRVRGPAFSSRWEVSVDP